MFYINSNQNNEIIINRSLNLTSAYTFLFKNKDEYNVKYSFDLTPTSVYNRYSVFYLNEKLKKGTYKFYIYENIKLIYNDVCFVNFKYTNIVVNDKTDKKIIID